MRKLKMMKFLLAACCFTTLFISCNKPFSNDNFTAYFGGEVSNPANKYVLFCKGEKVLDTIPLKADNTFFIKFDSLTPGLYTFRHDPEYQYVYFDKNDSLMVRLNSQDFDESVVFCGRGEEKNNFLMEMYLKNEYDRKKMFEVYEYDLPAFSRYIDSSYKSKVKFYDSRKEKIDWDEDFDAFAKASMDFNHYSKWELYPMVHRLRMGEDISAKLPANYYGYRDNIKLDNAGLADFSPFVKYLTYMLNNMAMSRQPKNLPQEEEALEMNVRKLNIADTLFHNEKIKNTVLNNVAFAYLLEDQNMLNNKKFLERYHQLSTDKSQHNEILKIGDAVKLLEKGNQLPEIALVDAKNNTVGVSTLAGQKSVIFFWTENLESHLVAAHKKVLELKQKHPDYNFIAINVDKDQAKWIKLLSKYKFGGITELRAADFEELKDKWVITKIHRTMITRANGSIEDAFVSLFDARFEDCLK